MLISLKNKKLLAKRGLSSVVGTLIMVAIVASIGSVVLFQGMNSINDFNYDLSFLTGSKDSLFENITIEHIRFNPSTNHVSLYLRNTGTQEVEIDKITMVKMDTQELILNNNTSEKIFISNLKNMTQLPTITGGISLGNGSWNHNNFIDNEYKISVTTKRGNSFETIARPFNS